MLARRATIVPSPDSGWYAKWNPSAVLASPDPAPVTVNVPFAKLAPPDNPTDPMSPSNQPAGRVVTVKEGLFTTWPFTVTVKGPDDTPVGTFAMMLVSLQLATGTVVPFRESALLPCGAPNPVPVIATSDPTTPEVGDKLVMLNTSTTVKLMPLLVTPLAFTTTFPVVAPLGTGTTMLVAFQLVGGASVPLNVTVLVPCAAPKFVPVIVTEVPTTPEVTDKLLMLGAGTTVKLTPLLAAPATVTTTFPVVAPDGTGAPMANELQLVGVVGVPLKVTVLEPWLAPKFVPSMVTAAPTAPVVGDRLVIPGRTVNAAPLLATPFAFTTTFPVAAP
jgi:hypothetical protein